MRLLAIFVASLVLAAGVLLLIRAGGGADGFREGGSVEAYRGIEGAIAALRSDRALTLFGWTAFGVVLIVLGFLLDVGAVAAILFFVGMPILVGAAALADSHLPGMMVYTTLVIAFLCIGSAGSLAMEGKLRFWQRRTTKAAPNRPDPMQRTVNRRR